MSHNHYTMAYKPVCLHPFFKQCWLAAIFMVFMISPSRSYAQGPVISYTSGQTYTAGNTIQPLVPAASNVGTAGYAISAADSNPAMHTILNIAKDALGNVYVVDQTNNVIKELPAGGGNAISLGSGFNMPMAVAVDGMGNLFVADYNNNAVKEIMAGSGTTVSIGSGFVNPYNVLIDTAGNIYVADVSAIPFKKLSRTGGYYTSSPLPAGLQLDPATGIISGRPTAVSPQNTYKIYAYNSSGIGTATVTMAVSQPQAAPTISYTTPQVYPAGEPISPIIPSTTGLTNAGYAGKAIASNSGGKDIDVFMIMGQSNALGRGDVTQSPPTVPGNIVYFAGAVSPANDPLPTTYSVKPLYGSMWPAFGNTYYALTGRHVCFIQASRGGSALVAAAQVGKGWWDATGQLSSIAAGQLQLASDSLKILGYAPVVKGFLWDQGEEDASAIADNVITQTAYTDTLVSLANRLRAQFGAKLPFYILRSGAFHPSPPDFMSWVRNAQEATLPIDSTMFIVTRNASTFNIRNLMNPDTVLNELHYSQPGYNEIGVTAAQGVVLSQQSPVSIQVFPGSAAVTHSGAASNLPAGVAADAAGNLYYASPASTAIVELPAGGGTPINLGSQFSGPFGLAVDGSGNIFVADAGNNAIKEIPQAGDTPITILAGLNHPNGVAVDSQGDIFIADTYNNAVKEIPAGGAVITIGSGFSSPFGVAVDQNGNLYIADVGNNAIKKITLSTGSIQVIGSGFKKPTGVAVDKTGNIYIADEGNNAVKEIPLNSGGTVVLGQGYSSPFGIAADNNGNVYVPNDANNGIKEINAAGAYTITPALPAGLAFDTHTGIISGTAISPSPATNYTVTASNSFGSQAVSVNIKITDNITLTNLLLSNGLVLSPFTPGTTSYTVNAPNTVSTVAVTPTTGDNSSVVSVDGTPVTSGTASANIPLPFGTTVVTVTVNAADGTSQTYTTNIVRTPSVNASLGGLTISNGALTPYFSTGTTNYTANVSNGVAAMTITPTAADATASIKVNGLTAISGNPSQSLPLAVGTNTIAVTLTAQDGMSAKTYTIVVTRAASSNDNLSGIKPGSGTLLPTFSPSVTAYTESVANTVASITILPTTAVSTSTVTINGTVVASGTASPAVSLAPGPNVIKVVVLAQDGVTNQTYTLTVTRIPSTNDNLSAFRISNGTLSPVFATGTTAYTVSVVNGVSSISITPTTTDATATVTVNGVAVASATATPVNLNVGGNTINTIVTAQDGISTKTYTITVTRAASTNANLSLIKLSIGTLSPAFAPATLNYTASVSNTVTSVILTPTTGVSTSTVTVNGIVVTSGSPSATIQLNAGSNTIITTVTAQDGVTTNTYKITITRAASNNDNLANLTLNGGTLSPAYSPGINSYTAMVANTVSSVTLTPLTNDSTATVTVNDIAIKSGANSGAIALNFGTTVINTVITAQDGITTNTYTITVSRIASVNANLSAMKLSAGAISPGFNTNSISYTSNVVNGVTSMIVTPTTSDVNATVTVNGTRVTSGTASAPVPLNVGANKILITVTAQDGVITKTYTVTETRAAATNANLSGLKFSAGALNPAFGGTTISYTASVINAVNSVMVTATTADVNATVTVNGTAVTSGSPSGSIAVSVGVNTFTIKVTAQDAVTAKTYTVNLTRNAPSANSFSEPVPEVIPQLAEGDNVVVHQAVSPNGDGINDFLTIESIGEYPDNRLNIYSRNGTLVYEAKGYNNTTIIFDGHSNKTGQMQSPGTYFYALDYTVNGVTKHKTGYIILKY